MHGPLNVKFSQNYSKRTPAFIGKHFDMKLNMEVVTFVNLCAILLRRTGVCLY
jgi:hypothetical protein